MESLEWLYLKTTKQSFKTWICFPSVNEYNKSCSILHGVISISKIEEDV
jgi:hypothetical protein